MKKIILLFATLCLSGCQYSDNPADPYEEYNRQTFAFNEQADHYVLLPAIQVYQTVTPNPLRMGIENFYSNLSEISYAINFGLQGQWQDCYNSGLRFTVNSSFGVGGIFDMATHIGAPLKRSGFGKTLYHLGYVESAYSVSPLFGPSTVRDIIGFSVDMLLLNPLMYFNSSAVKTEFLVLNYLETKSNLTEYSQSFTDVPFIEDRYTFVRDAYLQYRQYQLENKVMDWDAFYNDFSDSDFSETVDSDVIILDPNAVKLSNQPESSDPDDFDAEPLDLLTIF